MCMLQDTVSIKDVIVSLPPDVQALVVLYNGIEKNVSCKLKYKKSSSFFLFVLYE